MKLHLHDSMMRDGTWQIGAPSEFPHFDEDWLVLDAGASSLILSLILRSGRNWCHGGGGIDVRASFVRGGPLPAAVAHVAVTSAEQDDDTAFEFSA